jgi:hypothetical protein
MDRADPRDAKLHRLEENLASVNVELSADDLREIDGAASRLTVQGVRYPPHIQAMVDR